MQRECQTCFRVVLLTTCTFCGCSRWWWSPNPNPEHKALAHVGYSYRPTPLMQREDPRRQRYNTSEMSGTYCSWKKR